jgi:hypothetical protein
VIDSVWELVLPAVTSVIGMWVGVGVATYQLDRAAQRSAKMAAATLRADLQRSDRALGQSATAFGAVVYGMTFEPPRLHRWSEPLIVQLAEADSRIVEACLELDRELQNFSATVSMYFLVKNEQDEAEKRSRSYAQMADEEVATDGELLRRSGERITAEDQLRTTRERVREAIRQMHDPHQNAKALIADLVRYTSYIADLPLKEFLQLPEESRPRPA